MRAFSLFPSENELLLPPNFSFEIVSTFPAGHGLTLVQCKQTKTLDQLIDFGAAPSNWSTPMRVPQQQMMDRGMPGMPPMAQAQSNPDMQMQMMQQQMMQMQQMQMQQMQMQQQQPMQQPNANLNFPGKIETSEIKGCACHVCPAPPLAWWAIGCYEPKGPDRIGSWFQVAAVHPGVPWLPICEEHQRVPGTNVCAKRSNLTAQTARARSLPWARVLPRARRALTAWRLIGSRSADFHKWRFQAASEQASKRQNRR